MNAYHTHPASHTLRQERRIRWHHGLSEAQARIVARLAYGEGRA